MKTNALQSHWEPEDLLWGWQLVEEQDTNPVTVYRDWNGYWYKQGHIDMECKHSHVMWTEKDLETVRTIEKIQHSIANILSDYLL